MLEPIVPGDIMPPFNNAYSHGMVIPANARVLHVAGQVGADAHGVTPPDARGQAENIWTALVAILRDARMDVGDLVKLTAYLTDEAAYPAYAEVRGRYLGDLARPPASTAIIVARLLRPEWLIEVEAIAAKS